MCVVTDEMEIEQAAEGEPEGGFKQQQHQMIEFFEMCSSLITTLAR